MDRAVGRRENEGIHDGGIDWEESRNVLWKLYESLLRATFRTRPGEHVRRVRYSSFFLFLFFFFFLYIYTRVCILSHLARPVLDIIAYPRCLWKNRDGVDAVSSRCPLPGRLDNLSSSLFFSFLLFQLIPTRETGRERERKREGRDAC